MPKSNITNEMKNLVRETIKELLTDDLFVETVLKKINEKTKALEENLKQCKEKIELLETKMEDFKQKEKQNNICIYGIEQTDQENLTEKVLKVLNDKIKIPIKQDDVIKCHRIGVNTRKQRPVVVKFEKKQLRNLIIKNRKKLKGTNTFITEDLTKTRLELFREAQNKFEKKSVYTHEGNVFVIMGEEKQKISSIADILQLTMNHQD